MHISLCEIYIISKEVSPVLCLFHLFLSSRLHYRRHDRLVTSVDLCNVGHTGIQFAVLSLKFVILFSGERYFCTSFIGNYFFLY